MTIYTKSERSVQEVLARKDLYAAINELHEHVESTSFDECNHYAQEFQPQNASCIDSDAVNGFVIKRTNFFNHILQHANKKFGDEEDPLQKFYDHAKEKVCLIDPALIGQCRYDTENFFFVKVAMVIYFFFNGLLTRSSKVNKWIGRYEILRWGKEQDLVAFQGPHLFYAGEHDQKAPSSARERFIKTICIKKLGFSEERREDLEALFNHLPEIQSFHPKTETFTLRLEKAKGFPHWNNLSELRDKILGNKHMKELEPEIGKIHIDIPLKSNMPIVSGKIIKNEEEHPKIVLDAPIFLIVPTKLGGKIYVEFSGFTHKGKGRIVGNYSAGSTSWVVDAKLKARHLKEGYEKEISLPKKREIDRIEEYFHWV